MRQHPPFHKPTALLWPPAAKPPPPTRHNCSGKHTGMLAQCVLRGFSKQNYLDFNHRCSWPTCKPLPKMCDLPTSRSAWHRRLLRASARPAALQRQLGLRAPERPPLACPPSAPKPAADHPRHARPPDMVPPRPPGYPPVARRAWQTLLENGRRRLSGRRRAAQPFPAAGAGHTHQDRHGDSDGRARNVVTIEILRQLV